MSTHQKLHHKLLFRGSCLILTAAAALSAAPGSPAKTEIIWDKLGVPHIFATDRESMFYAHGWAQMRSQANLLLQLYGESRARSAEYWGGEANLQLDRWFLTNKLPELGKRWYPQQDPVFRRYMDAFARGINDYAKKHPDTISAEYRVVLPVTGIDVVQHSLRVVHFMYMGSQARLQREVRPLLSSSASLNVDNSNEETAIPGSNTWSIGPAHSASGNSMLVINPHLAWGNTFYRYVEVHLVGPGYDLYGAPQIGFPVPVVGFNRHTGWGRTVNTMDTVDFYRLKLLDGGSYEFDGKPMSFERDTKVLKVRQADGSLREEKLEVRRSVHGPVVFDEDQAGGRVTLAMRVAGLDRPKMLEQWFRMGEATNLAQFKEALRMGAVPMWNANYADDQGHIMLVDNGLIPRRGSGDFDYWSKVVPGHTSTTLWKDYLTFEELPRSEDPPSGWNQNTNEPPWTATLPPLDRRKYPSWTAPTGENQLEMRTLRSLNMLSEKTKLTFEKLLEYKHSTRMELADRVLPDVLAAADPKSEAAQVLAKWDRNTNAESRGAVLFQMFTTRYLAAGPGGLAAKMRVKFDPSRPVETARGLADPAAAAAALERVAAECKSTYGSLDIPWGDVYRVASGNADLPGNGGPGASGIFRTMTYANKKGNRYYANHGETFVCVIEFAPKNQQRAQCGLSYGNSSQTGSKHLEDQLPLFVKKQLHPVVRDRKELEKDAELRETF